MTLDTSRVPWYTESMFNQQGSEIMQRTVISSDGREGQAIPSEDPQVALVLWNGEVHLTEVPIIELTFN